MTADLLVPEVAALARARRVVAVPLGIERRALRTRLPGTPAVELVSVGYGPRRAAAAARRLVDPGTAAGLAGLAGLVVAGVAGSLDAGVRPGAIVVGTEVRDEAGGLVCRVPAAPLLAGALSRNGVQVYSGPVVSVAAPVTGRRRPDVAALADPPALAVDLETAVLARAVPAETGFAVVRAISDAPGAELFGPGVARQGLAALRALRRAAPVIAEFLAATGRHHVLLIDAESASAPVPPADLVLALPGAAVASSAGPAGCARVCRVNDISDLPLALLAARRVAVVAGARTPPHRIGELIAVLRGLGPVALDRSSCTFDPNRFLTPTEVS